MNKIRDIIAKIRIPKDTCYCYKPKRFVPSHHPEYYLIKPCPYWKKLKGKDSYGNAICYCKYLKQKSEQYDPCNLIWDMLKECGVNDYD